MSQPLLSASAILDAEDLKEDTVDVPEWGGAVRLVQMNAEESAAFSREMDTQKGADDGMYLMLIYSAKDAAGTRVLTVEDLPRLRKKSITVLNKLQMISLRLNGMTVAGNEALKKD